MRFNLKFRHFSQHFLCGLIACGTSGNILVSADPISKKELGELQAKLKKTDYLHVQFEQTIFKALRGRTVEQKGEAYFARPNRFRWVLEHPIKEELVYDGKIFSQYRPSDSTLIQHEAKSQRFRQIDQLMDLVLNLDSLTERFDAVDPVKFRQDLSLGLLPKKDSELGASVRRVDVTISLARNYLKSLKITYHVVGSDGQVQNGPVDIEGARAGYLDIRFKNPRTSVISADTFQVKVPKHVKKSPL